MVRRQLFIVTSSMRPLDYYFSSTNPDEKILHIVHRHWFNLFLKYIPILLLLAMMITGAALYPQILSAPGQEAQRMLFLFVNSLMLLLMWVYGFLTWFDYHLDIWILTNYRIVNVSQKGLFTRQVSELKYESIQDVTTDVKGFFPTLLNFGTLSVQTAAEQSRFLIESVGNPYAIKAEIMTNQKRARLRAATKPAAEAPFA